MSTYIDARRPSHHGDYQDCPPLVVRYLYDSETIRGLSPRTVNGYYIDLRTFFRFLKLQRGMVPKNTPLDEIDEMCIRDRLCAFFNEGIIISSAGAIPPGTTSRRKTTATARTFRIIFA